MATATAERPLWPALGGIWGESLGEFLGTMVLILFGDGCVAGVLLFGAGNVNAGTSTLAAAPSILWTNWMVIALGWGLAVTLGVYTAGTLSGAHINPAVTLAFAARGKFPWAKVAPYIVAQVLGAFVAAAILWAVYHGAFMQYEHLHGVTKDGTEFSVFATSAKSFVGNFGAFMDEVLGTALLVGLIFAIVDVRNSPPQANLAPLIIGFLVVAIGLSFGYNTGYAINPARDFGPRLWAALVGFPSGLAIPGHDNYFLIPIIGPIVGGIIGAFVYDFTVHQALVAKPAPPSGKAEQVGVTDRVPDDTTESGRTRRER
jgi:glycerol uptake facilitator protein